MICTGYWSSTKHITHRGQDSVDNSFSMKMLVNCAHIWSVNLVQFQNDAAGAILFKVPSFGILIGDGQQIGFKSRKLLGAIFRSLPA